MSNKCHQWQALDRVCAGFDRHSLAGTVTCAVSLMKTFQSVKYRTFRAGLFATLGLWGIVPGLHALILYGSASQMRNAFILDLCMGLVYLVRL